MGVAVMWVCSKAAEVTKNVVFEAENATFCLEILAIQ